jgi:UDP-N-acetyl-D-galactosamine dehydrogenase
MPEVLERGEIKTGTSATLPAVAIVGLGYVGLPVAVAFGRQRPTIGYDLSKKRIENLRHHVDATGEVSTAELLEAREFRATSYPSELGEADFIIVAVPTPINAARQPDLSPLESASETVGRYMKPGATVVYESTVYPGATEEVCVPILEKASGMRWRQDFHVGYSPEAGVHRASSIRVAEAAKVIENTQRDLNIAFVNELAIIFERMGLDTTEVLKAAGTKWNFLPFRPGLVGGHCIGVDPYYLTHKAELMGYHPEVILAGRRINDGMGSHIARKTVQQMIHAGRNIKGARVNVLGLTFKEDVPDIRNSKVIDIIRELHEFGVETFVHDPQASPDDALHEYGVRLAEWDSLPAADALILAVAHRKYLELPTEALLRKVVRAGCLIDVKSVLDAGAFRKEGLRVWRL